MSALLHREFRMLLMDLAVYAETQRERQLASLTLDLYDADPDNPKVAKIVTDFTTGALHESRS